MNDTTQQKPVFTNICIGGPLHGTQYRADNVDFFRAEKIQKTPKLTALNGANLSTPDQILYNKGLLRSGTDRDYFYWVYSELSDQEGRDLLLGFVLDLMTKMQGG